ncbi:MAG: hypothetical protein A3F77_01890 [Betaproteobacteria bacterium RIFCSPLOWO2_12_FULL_67_28]|nr:MAG: hypothetical protein A3F77_01890 [Betaproteobacteria bacterium RIFCSPLOWO2_12_FULL_67_28]
MSVQDRLLSTFVLLAALLAAGCASVPMASLEDDTRAKTHAVRPDKSNIYVYRNETLGGAISMTVTLNGRVAGQSGPQTYFMFEVDPGTYELSSIAENTSALKLTTAPGRAYYLWQEAKMGMWMARTLLQQVDEDTGRKGVAECKRAQSAF